MMQINSKYLQQLLVAFLDDNTLELANLLNKQQVTTKIIDSV
jgi:hypothetical protein